LIAGTLGVMAVPSHTPKLMEIEGMAQLMQLEQKLEIYRMVMETYREEHKVYPGYGYGQKGSWLHGQPSGSDFTRQLIYCSTEWGRTSSSDPLSYPYGPYLYSGLPKNPINGLDTVRILTDDQTFPAEPDSLTGWIYKPATGEIHANSIGDSIVSGIPFYQL
jgi:hypothetical protein